MTIHEVELPLISEDAKKLINKGEWRLEKCYADALGDYYLYTETSIYTLDRRGSILEHNYRGMQVLRVK